MGVRQLVVYRLFCCLQSSNQRQGMSRFDKSAGHVHLPGELGRGNSDRTFRNEFCAFLPPYDLLHEIRIRYVGNPLVGDLWFDPESALEGNGAEQIGEPIGRLGKPLPP